mgnify:CR=1 FL=1
MNDGNNRGREMLKSNDSYVKENEKERKRMM